MSAARTEPNEDAKIAQVETQARTRFLGLFEPAITPFPTPLGMALRSNARERK